MQSSREDTVNAELIVVGGFYRESCRFPPSDEFWGSGGRAAAAIAELGIRTTFVTAADRNAEAILASIAEAVGFAYSAVPIPETIAFRYDHGLSSPIIWPPPNAVERTEIEVRGQCVLHFGMLEADVEVEAATVVYDPQEPFSPKHFRSPHRPGRLAYVLNGAEAKRLGRAEDLNVASRRIADEAGANVVVVKCGARGALVLADGEFSSVPAYEARSVWPIGSGDVFAAIFAARWAVQGVPAPQAANEASRATADYVANRTLPIPRSVVVEGESSIPLRLSMTTAQEGAYDVYLAGPFFNMPQTWLVDEAKLALQGMGLKVFSPYHDIGIGLGADVAPKDIEALEKSSAVFAILDGTDTGTVFEAGYARARNKPVVAFAQCTPEEPLKMISGTGCEVVSDFVSAIYRVAWAALR